MYMYMYIYVYINVESSFIFNSFFVCRSVALYLFCSLFFMISRKANGRYDRFYDAELP